MSLRLSDYDIPEEAAGLKDFMNQVLETVVSVFESYNMPLPTRRYWAIASTPVDCEQVTVSLVNLYLGLPGDQATTPLQCNSPKSAVVNIAISRPVATVTGSGKAPLGEKIQAGAEFAAYDAWILMDNLEQFDQWESAGNGMGVIATVATTPPQGGYLTTNMQLTLAVPG